MPSCRAVVLISGGGTNLQTLIDQTQNDRIHATIGAVISNRPDAFGLERAKQAGIETHVVDHKRFETRELFDKELAKAIDETNPDIVILAGFMRILSEWFVSRYEGRMINIHPSLLPKYKGLHTHRRALEAGDSEHGVSVHFVTPELDGGPIIAQAIVPVLANDDEETLSTRVLQQEHRIYPLVFKWFADGTLRLVGSVCHFNGQPLTEPFNLR